MLELIGQILFWLRGRSLKLLTLAGIILLISGTFSPVGTLIWWLSQEAEDLGLTKSNPPKRLQTSSGSNPKSLKINCYIVFLPGVGNFSTDQLTSGEALFVDRLVQSHPNCVGVRDVFPYSAANESLGGGERLLAPLWRFANDAEGWLDVANVLIKIRNLWRFAISADSRYGLIYNQGIATAIIDRMNAAYPIPTKRKPFKIILIGTSGGAQVALAAAPYLDQWLDPQLVVLSLGGVFAGQDGFNAAERVYHLRGRQDWIENIGSIVFPSRWPWAVGSAFNQARQQGNYTVNISGPHAHDGPTGYFGEELVANGDSYLDLTLQQVNQLPIWSHDDL